MPTKTHRQQVRMPADLLEKILELGKHWGPVRELTPSEVVRECVERTYVAVFFPGAGPAKPKRHRA